jgi:hypothetical protein
MNSGGMALNRFSGAGAGCVDRGCDRRVGIATETRHFPMSANGMDFRKQWLPV